MPQLSPPNSRFSFIDALRGLAALGVVIYHAVEGNHVSLLPQALRQVASLGALGVPVFFVISGFVISNSLKDGKMTGHRFGRFVLKRSIRLDPPYWAAIAISIGFSFLASKLVSERASEIFTVSQVAAHVAYLQNILGYRNINPVFWTLCYEVQFYFVFALLLFFDARRMVILAFVISLIWCFRFAPNLPGIFLSLWFAFLLGAGAWFARNTPKMAPVFLAYWLAVFGAGLIYRDPFVITCCCTAALIYILLVNNKLEITHDWKILQFLGLISYSMYLLHNPITGAVFRVGYLLTGNNALTESFWWAMSIVATVLASWMLYMTVERPCVQLAKSINQRGM